jgi:hypothetical protein
LSTNYILNNDKIFLSHDNACSFKM